MNVSPDPLVWFAALLTLSIFSFLYKDNPFYRFAEHLFVGTSMGYWIALTWHNAVKPNLWIPLVKEHNLLYIIPLILGLFYFLRFVPRLNWLVRLPIAFSLGWASGVAIPAVLQASIIKQIQGTMLTPAMFNRWDTGLWSVVILIGVICTILFFFFSVERRGVMKPIAQIGITFLMIGFGASFGYTVMARISLLIGRMQFLLRDWLGIVQ